VHINYANRITSKDEAEANFVVDWCNTILHIPCYVRHITEINRQQCMDNGFRELYETYTRNVRYFAYKEFGQDAKIVLGHNKDDIMENIFTNIANKNKYDNLDGMTEYSTQDGICFWRPLLNLSKEEIISYAHANNIPYLPNSTPTWSQRGQIRNSIVPVINKWNPQFIPALHDLSDTLNEYHEIMNRMIDEIICREPLYIDTLHISKIFWRSLFAKLGYENISNKSLNHMCERLSYFKDSMRINISKNLSINIKVIEKVYYLNLNKTI
jgi:tRNA(Ile)-lysidine synthase TilS/MesJ